MIRKIIILLLISINVYAFEIEKGITGSWFDQENSGQGINIEILSENRVVVYWYAYDQGNPLWLTGVGTYKGDTAEVELSVFEGSNFGVSHDRSLVSSKVFGSLSVTFDSCNTGKMTYDSIQSFGRGSIKLNRLTEVTGLPCTTPTTSFSQNVVSSNDISIKPRTCILRGDLLACEFNVTALEADTDIKLKLTESSVNIDGKVYTGQRATFGSEIGTPVGFGGITQSLTKGVPVLAKMNFSEIPSETQIINLLKLGFRKDGGKLNMDYLDAIVVNQN